MKGRFLALVIGLALALFAGPAAYAVEEKPAPVIVTDENEMLILEDVRARMLDFSSYMSQCMGGNRDYAQMTMCLCQTKDDFTRLYYKTGGLIAAYPALKGAVAQYKTPESDEPVTVDIGSMTQALLKYKPHMCGGS